MTASRTGTDQANSLLLPYGDDYTSSESDDGGEWVGAAPLHAHTVNANAAASDGTLVLACTPWPAARGESISQVVFQVLTAGAGMTAAWLAVYAESAATPGVWDRVAVTADTPSMFTSTGIKTVSFASAFRKASGVRYGLAVLPVGDAVTVRGGNYYLSGSWRTAVPGTHAVGFAHTTEPPTQITPSTAGSSRVSGTTYQIGYLKP